MQALGSSCEVQFFGDRHKAAQVTKFHGCVLQQSWSIQLATAH
jgi:hypothetical protein